MISLARLPWVKLAISGAVMLALWRYDAARYQAGYSARSVELADAQLVAARDEWSSAIEELRAHTNQIEDAAQKRFEIDQALASINHQPEQPLYANAIPIVCDDVVFNTQRLHDLTTAGSGGFIDEAGLPGGSAIDAETVAVSDFAARDDGATD